MWSKLVQPICCVNLCAIDYGSEKDGFAGKQSCLKRTFDWLSQRLNAELLKLLSVGD